MFIFYKLGVTAVPVSLENTNYTIIYAYENNNNNNNNNE